MNARITNTYGDLVVTTAYGPANPDIFAKPAPVAVDADVVTTSAGAVATGAYTHQGTSPHITRPVADRHGAVPASGLIEDMFNATLGEAAGAFVFPAWHCKAGDPVLIGDWAGYTNYANVSAGHEHPRYSGIIHNLGDPWPYRPFHKATSHVEITVCGGTIVWTRDQQTTPAPGLGHLAVDPDRLVFRVSAIRDMKFAVASGDPVLYVSELSGGGH